MTLKYPLITLASLLSFSAIAQEDTTQMHFEVSAQANVYYNYIYDFKKVYGGAGIKPVIIDVRDVKYITIEKATGEVSPFTDSAGTFAGADGGLYKKLKTRVSGLGPLSGIQHDRVMFLSGVFTSYPSDFDEPYPAFDYTKEDNFPKYWPALNQTFFVGDGKMENGKAQLFFVPSDAETLSLGFADCLEGTPDNYKDNTGQLHITIILHRDTPKEEYPHEKG